MTERDTITILRQCLDMVADDLEGQPLDIERPGKEDMVIVAASTYSRLIQRICELEAELKTDEEHEEDEQELLRILRHAENGGGKH